MSLTPEQLGKPLKVIRRIQETSDAVSLVLQIPEDLKILFRYQAGQFVSFFLDIDGEKLSRSYSLSTSPEMDRDFKVTIKKVVGGRGSTYLCESVKEGDVLLTTPPAGHFFKSTHGANEGIHYFLFAAGSGITPVYSILKTVLHSSDKNSVTLLYCNRNQDSIIYKTELEEWTCKFGNRLNVVHTLTKPHPGWDGPTGRISSDLIARSLKTVSLPNREFYLCGPTDFMQTIKSTLLANSIPESKIRIEDFGVTVHKPGPQVKDNWTFIGPDKITEAPEKIIAEINGEIFEVKISEGQNILETLLQAGAQPPYSCMDGACMACLAKIQQGRVYQEDPGILSDDNIQNCESLTCQAKPLSRIVKLSYDNL